MQFGTLRDGRKRRDYAAVETRWRLCGTRYQRKLIVSDDPCHLRDADAHPEESKCRMQQFLEGFRADDGVTFVSVCESARPTLDRWLRAHGCASDSIDDILQAAFLTAWLKRRAFCGRGSVVGWLLRIARSELNRVRRHDLKNELKLSGDWQQPLSATHDLLDDIRRFLDTGGDDCLQHALQSLTPRQRDAVLLYYYCNYSAREIGNALRCGENGAKSLLHRSRARMKRFLGPALAL